MVKPFYSRTRDNDDLSTLSSSNTDISLKTWNDHLPKHQTVTLHISLSLERETQMATGWNSCCRTANLCISGHPSSLLQFMLCTGASRVQCPQIIWHRIIERTHHVSVFLVPKMDLHNLYNIIFMTVGLYDSFANSVYIYGQWVARIPPQGASGCGFHAITYP